MNRTIVALVTLFVVVAVACTSSLEGDSVVVDFRVPECQNASYIEIDGDFYIPVGPLPSDWEGLPELDVEITGHVDDRISVEDENGRIAEFVDPGGAETTECVNW